MATFEKGFEVIPAKPGAQRKTYTVGNKKFSFNGHNTFHMKDAGEARELEARWGGTKKSESDDIRVIPIGDIPADPTGVHKYTFSMRHLGDWKSRIDWQDNEGSK